MSCSISPVSGAYSAPVAVSAPRPAAAPTPAPLPPLSSSGLDVYA
ncbi:hypothetical protein ACTHAM_003238 [Cellulomonas soli]